MTRIAYFLLSWLTAICAAAFTLVMSVIIVGFASFTSRRLQDEMITFWARGLVRFSGVRVKKFGLENLLPPNIGAVYVFNHTSHFDIPFIHSSIERSIRFGAKAELFRIPFFGWAIKKGNALKIERQSLSSVMKVYDKAIDRIKNGEGFVLAPEGTRQKSPQLGRFKSGPFILAINAQAPVVPVVLKNVWQVMPKGTLSLNWKWERVVEVIILPPVSSLDYTLDTKDKFRETVREKMENALNSK